MMKSWLSVFLFFGVVASAAQVKVTKLDQFDMLEPFEAHLFHAGLLWTGRSVTHEINGGLPFPLPDYHLEVFAADGKPVENIPLPHQLKFIIPYGENAVAIVGVMLDKEHTAYTIVTVDGGDLKATTHVLPIDVWADRILGEPGKVLVTEPGQQGIFHVDGEAFEKLPAIISGFQIPLWHDGHIWTLISHHGTASNLLKLAPGDEKPKTVLRDLQIAQDIIALENPTRLAISEKLGGEVKLLDPKTEKVTATIVVKSGTPKSLAQLGRCLVVGSQVSKNVEFHDLAKGKLVATWDLTAAGFTGANLSKLAVDPKTGAVFARSSGNFAADNQVALVQEASGETCAACTK